MKSIYYHIILFFYYFINILENLKLFLKIILKKKKILFSLNFYIYIENR